MHLPTLNIKIENKKKSGAQKAVQINDEKPKHIKRSMNNYDWLGYAGKNLAKSDEIPQET
jgi:hypothetical protein